MRSSMVTFSSLPSSCSHGPITAGPWLPARAVTRPLSSNRKVQSDGTLRREGCGGWCGSGPGVPCGWCSEIPPHFSSKGKTDTTRECVHGCESVCVRTQGEGRAGAVCVWVCVCWALVLQKWTGPGRSTAMQSSEFPGAAQSSQGWSDVRGLRSCFFSAFLLYFGITALSKGVFSFCDCTFMPR